MRRRIAERRRAVASDEAHLARRARTAGRSATIDVGLVVVLVRIRAMRDETLATGARVAHAVRRRVAAEARATLGRAGATAIDIRFGAILDPVLAGIGDAQMSRRGG